MPAESDGRLESRYCTKCYFIVLESIETQELDSIYRYLPQIIQESLVPEELISEQQAAIEYYNSQRFEILGLSSIDNIENENEKVVDEENCFDEDEDEEMKKAIAESLKQDIDEDFEDIKNFIEDDQVFRVNENVYLNEGVDHEFESLGLDKQYSFETNLKIAIEESKITGEKTIQDYLRKQVEESLREEQSKAIYDNLVNQEKVKVKVEVMGGNNDSSYSQPLIQPKPIQPKSIAPPKLLSKNREKFNISYIPKESFIPGHYPTFPDTDFSIPIFPPAQADIQPPHPTVPNLLVPTPSTILAPNLPQTSTASANSFNINYFRANEQSNPTSIPTQNSLSADLANTKVIQQPSQLPPTSLLPPLSLQPPPSKQPLQPPSLLPPPSVLQPPSLLPPASPLPPASAPQPAIPPPIPTSQNIVSYSPPQSISSPPSQPSCKPPPAIPSSPAIPTPHKKDNIEDNSNLYPQAFHIQPLNQDPRIYFQILKKIGSGSNGQVYLAKEFSTNKIFAIKILKPTNQSEKTLILNEMKFTINLNHENIIKYFNLYEINNEIWIVEELMACSLADLILDRPGQIPEPIVAYLLREMLQGLSYMHDRQLIHRDMKSDNILLSLQGHVKIGDLGYCAEVSKENPNRQTFAGTLLWMAPEILGQDFYNSKIDIWSIGIIALELIMGEPPYYKDNHQKIVISISKRQAPRVDRTKHSISDELDQFICACLVKDPSQRADCKFLLSMPFITVRPCSSSEFREYFEEWKLNR